MSDYNLMMVYNADSEFHIVFDVLSTREPFLKAQLLLMEARLQVWYLVSDRLP